MAKPFHNKYTPNEAPGFSERDSPLVVVVGPTGSGKSELALCLARRFPAEIVNCDSIQLYRGLDIGAAKVPPAARQSVPHHMLDVAGPAESLSAGEYARRARAILRQIAAARRVPIVVGGTGFYLSALLDGLFEGPPRDDDLRRRLAFRERRHAGALHRLLSRLDPPSAARIHPRDHNKLIRALEVRLLTGRPISQMFRQGRSRLAGFRWLKLGLDPPRAGLYRRLDQRAARMFAAGLVDEVRGLLDSGVPAGARALESVGYRQALAVVRGEITPDDALRLTQNATRQYAKRQWTWFRRDPDIQWFSGFGDDPRLEADAIERVTRFLLAFPSLVTDPGGTFFDS